MLAGIEDVKVGDGSAGTGEGFILLMNLPKLDTINYEIVCMIGKRVKGI